MAKVSDLKIRMTDGAVTVELGGEPVKGLMALKIEIDSSSPRYQKGERFQRTAMVTMTLKAHLELEADMPMVVERQEHLFEAKHTAVRAAL